MGRGVVAETAPHLAGQRAVGIEIAQAARGQPGRGLQRAGNDLPAEGRALHHVERSERRAVVRRQPGGLQAQRQAFDLVCSSAQRDQVPLQKGQLSARGQEGVVAEGAGQGRLPCRVEAPEAFEQAGKAVLAEGLGQDVEGGFQACMRLGSLGAQALQQAGRGRDQDLGVAHARPADITMGGRGTAEN